MLHSHNKSIMKPLKMRMLIYIFLTTHLLSGVNSQLGYERVPECQALKVMVRDAEGTLQASEVFVWLLTFELLCEKGNSWKPCKLPDQKNPVTPFFSH